MQKAVDRDWIDRDMAIRQIKYEYSPFDENYLENYLDECIKQRKPTDAYAQGLWDAIQALCYLPNKEYYERKNMKHKTLISAIIAGLLIGIGGTAYLSIDNKVAGAFIFSIGLLLICLNAFNLFTGKLCYANSKEKFIDLIIIWVGNLIGCFIIAMAMRSAKPGLITTAQEMCSNKLSEGFYVIVLGIFCNILIYFAVNGFIPYERIKLTNTGMEYIQRNIHDYFGRYIILIICIMAFILCGFEHCIANMYYFIVAGMFDIKYILLNTLGNFIGGFSIKRINDYLET